MVAVPDLLPAVAVLTPISGLVLSVVAAASKRNAMPAVAVRAVCVGGAGDRGPAEGAASRGVAGGGADAGVELLAKAVVGRRVLDCEQLRGEAVADVDVAQVHRLGRVRASRGQAVDGA